MYPILQNNCKYLDVDLGILINCFFYPCSLKFQLHDIRQYKTSGLQNVKSIQANRILDFLPHCISALCRISLCMCKCQIIG